MLLCPIFSEIENAAKVAAIGRRQSVTASIASNTVVPTATIPRTLFGLPLISASTSGAIVCSTAARRIKPILLVVKSDRYQRKEHGPERVPVCEKNFE